MALGDIGAKIDELEVDWSKLLSPSICHVSGDIYAIAYRGPGNDGYLATIDITSVGQIGAAVIDSWEFDAADSNYIIITKVSGTTYAIAYQVADFDGWVVTLTIANDGTITKAIIDSLEFDAGQASPFSFLKLAANYFVIAYAGTGSHGWLATINIDDAGNIAAAITGSHEFDATLGEEPSLINIAATVYAIAYRGPDNDGWLKTITISDLGIIGAEIDSLEFDTNHSSWQPSLVKARGTFYAIAYRGIDDDGFLAVANIANDGTIADALVDSYEFDPNSCYWPCCISTGAPYIAVSYRTAADAMTVKTFMLDDTGHLNNTTLDTGVFAPDIWDSNKIISISGNTYAIIYTKAFEAGHLITIPIESYWPPQYILSGTVKQKGSPVQRPVRAYTRSTGVLYSSGASGADGSFELEAPDDTTEMFVVAFDDDAGEQYNDLIYGRVKGVHV